MDPLAWYTPDNPGADLFASSPPDIAKAWQAFAAGIAALPGGLGEVQGWVDRHVQDLGLAFRLTGDVEERAWPLSPLPVVIGAEEWQTLSNGLIQRADLLEAVVADIYGPQKLITDSHLPAAAISGSADFARRMVGLPPTGGRHLKVCAIDLARGPTGEWRVLADRVRLPIGIGYVRENRLALLRTTGPLLGEMNARRLLDFYNTIRDGIAATCQRADPRIALLTPGRFTQSYPEQAHLARHLGFSLVEGRDLVEREGKIYVRTIAGLKRIDALWRWINTRDIDPLAFDARSEIGVPNLLNACATGGLVMANWPGAGVVEARVMSAFLPALCKTLFDQPLALPNAATWWCGQPTERAHVRQNFANLVIGPAFRLPVAGLPDGRSKVVANLTDDECETLLNAIERRPMDYVGQEIVDISTTPTVVGNRIEPRGFTLRAFLARDADGMWQVLPGGFARISADNELRTALMGENDLSADLCIVDPAHAQRTATPPPMQPPAVRRQQGLLPSQAADNLFWLGRYSERANQTARLIRVLLDSGNVAAIDPKLEGISSPVRRISGLLDRLGAASVSEEQRGPLELAEPALNDASLPGSVASLAISGRKVSLLLRDRLSHDAWRILNRPVPTCGQDAESLSAACDILIERYAAQTQMMADTMGRGPAWHFLQMGTAVERANMILQSAMAMVPGKASAEDLAALLDLVEGQAAYRSRYLAMPFIAPVLDIVLLDPAQPGSLAFQADRIAEHLSALPPMREDGMTEPALIAARQLVAQLEGLEADSLDPDRLDDLLSRLRGISEAISERYFLQVAPPEDDGKAPLLG
ncbi:hypothetical protein AB433_09845 [Croceicoccus naphthovorans]|uniref:Uncharacterized protein n=2 Tax=Croceicoccus naphthovorans TaxID=1348774 RepID=A0A0G3XFA0_9SPHN|nr:hypothetical protein AB433_09845 [Croceicoccus naphthovorans]